MQCLIELPCTIFVTQKLNKNTVKIVRCTILCMKMQAILKMH